MATELLLSVPIENHGHDKTGLVGAQTRELYLQMMHIQF